MPAIRAVAGPSLSLCFRRGAVCPDHSLLPYSLLATRYSLHRTAVFVPAARLRPGWFIPLSAPRNEGERSAERRGGACEAPPACLRGRPGACEAPAPPCDRGRSPLGAPLWRFWA